MAKRLTELYAVKEPVEVLIGNEMWIPGMVARHEHPAVWVQTIDGRYWFVTNRQRIRKLSDETRSH
jgi:hypothetical protein